MKRNLKKKRGLVDPKVERLPSITSAAKKKTSVEPMMKNSSNTETGGKYSTH